MDVVLDTGAAVLDGRFDTHMEDPHVVPAIIPDEMLLLSFNDVIALPKFQGS
jgi:hypothetical protein